MTDKEQIMNNFEKDINVLTKAKLIEQLISKTQECEELKNKLACQLNINNHLADYQVTANKLMDCYRKALEEIEEIVNEPCVADVQEDCKHCDIWCEHKYILDIIRKAKGE